MIELYCIEERPQPKVINWIYTYDKEKASKYAAKGCKVEVSYVREQSK